MSIIFVRMNNDSYWVFQYAIMPAPTLFQNEMELMQVLVAFSSKFDTPIISNVRNMHKSTSLNQKNIVRLHNKDISFSNISNMKTFKLNVL